MACAVLVLLLQPLPACAAAAPRAARVWQPAGRADLDGTLLRDAGDSIVIASSGGAQVALPIRSLGVEDLRYLKNVREAGPFRDWHFTRLPAPMSDWPTVVHGSFVRVVGEDLKFSEAVVELIRDDYRRRCYPLKALSDEDRALALRLQTEADAQSPHSTAQAAYETRYRDYKPGDAGVHFAESRHFLFQWGDDHNGSGKIVFEDPNFIRQNEYWFEKVWNFFDQKCHAPMPMANAAKKYKICVYITGTGLAHHKEGFAFGSEGIVISPAAMGYGSGVVPHEFTHVIQFYSGGFRDNPLVGWFWECHANWSAHQFLPAYAAALEVYFERQHYELNSTRMNYGSWPFLQYLGECPGIGTGFVYDLWRDALRDSKGQSLEDPFQAIMRLGVKHGYFAGNGVANFGDVIGQVAAHDVNWDYTPQFFYDSMWRGMLKYTPTVNRTRTLLHPVPDRPGFYRPIFSHTPRQYGVNLIDLELDPSATAVDIDFQGIVDESEGSDWRVTLVAIDKRGDARYSRTIHQGKLSMTLKPGERKLALAVAAAPTIYKPQLFRPGYGRKPRFPYEVSFKGCHPATEPPQVDLPRAQGRAHSNGGGFVANSAKVAPTAYVGPNARVLEGARVMDHARIEGHAVVSGQATIAGSAIIGDWARVMERAKVEGDARVRDCAVIRGQAALREQARVIEYAVLQGNGAVQGHALVKGFGEIDLDPQAPIQGGTICGEDLEVHLDGRHQPIDGGMVYGFNSAEILAKELRDNHDLYAHWDFDEPRATVLKDAFADCQGVLRGKPLFVKDGLRTALSLNGRDQYALVEGHVVDAAELTFDMAVKWSGGAASQSLFDFGCPDGNIAFTPADAQGEASLVMIKGAVRQTMVATEPLPKNRWVRITISIGNGMGKIFFDGRLVAEQKAMTLRAEDIGATCGYLGRRYAGGGYFAGLMDDFAVYRAAVASPTDLIPDSSAPTRGQHR